MIYQCGVNLHFSEGELHVTQLVNHHPGGELTHRNRKERGSHRLSEDVSQSRPCAVKTENANFIIGVVRGFKKWQPLDVGPMRIGHEQLGSDRYRLKFCLNLDTQ